MTQTKDEAISFREAVRLINERTGLKLDETFLYHHRERIPYVLVQVRRIRKADIDKIISIVLPEFHTVKPAQTAS
jgi:hypothetical protein